MPNGLKCDDLIGGDMEGMATGHDREREPSLERRY